MREYRNKPHKFTIELPDDWRTPGVISRLLKLDRQPQFYGPNESSLKFAIGHISPEPSVKEQQQNLDRIVKKWGHDVLDIGSIQVYGKEHATIVCGTPSISPGSPMPVSIPHSHKIKYVDYGTKVVIPSPYYVSHRVLKNYSLIFNGFEYFATVGIDRFPEEKFDEIVKTFRLF